MAFVLAASLSGCFSGVSQEEYDKVLAELEALKAQVQESGMSQEAKDNNGNEESKPEEEPSLPVDSFDEEKALSKLEVAEFKYDGMFSNYHFFVIKNNSEFNLSISADVKFYNDAGELIGAKNASEDAFEAGTETALSFMVDEPYAKTEYELTVEEEDRYGCVISDLSYETTPAKNKEIVSVTNNGDKEAEFVEGIALFFYGDQLVYHSRTYFTDDDHELKPGKTETRELSCFEEYDSLKLYFTGRR